MNSNEVIKKLQIKNGKLQVQIERLKLDKEEYYLDYLDLHQRIDKAIEYITSYESIEEIQHTERIKDNKDLDYKTMVEMNRRYLIVHDKLLDILRGEDNE